MENIISKHYNSALITLFAENSGLKGPNFNFSVDQINEI